MAKHRSPRAASSNPTTRIGRQQAGRKPPVEDDLVAQFRAKLGVPPAAREDVVPRRSPRVLSEEEVWNVPEDRKKMWITDTSCGVFEDLEPQALGVSLVFETPESGPPFDLPISIVTSRIADPGMTPAPDEPNQFSVSHTLRAIPSGLGRVSATVRIPQANSGLWRVRAQAEPLIAPMQATGATAFRPLINVSAPGVVIGAWPAMVAIGALVGSTLLAWLASRAGIAMIDIVWLALVSCLAGTLGAKAYFLAEARTMAAARSGAGMCLQGFVIASLATFVIGTWVLGLPTLVLLNMATPGLLIGMALGRLGCWAGGCCTGRLSSSRFALWSSDRSIGARRIPTQLLESSAGFILAIVTLLMVLMSTSVPGASVLAFGLGAYIFARQMLFPLRSQPRKTKFGRLIVMTVAAAAALYASVILVIVGISS
ncbi:MAG: prolipoprotein diacylglyceryl transferase [Candidatus Nanopelagicales bacterium]|nr:prolipoprotein diacylglyceryl transferase [Candidatus Nanopelagicales bacterium]